MARNVAAVDGRRWARNQSLMMFPSFTKKNETTMVRISAARKWTSRRNPLAAPRRSRPPRMAAPVLDESPFPFWAVLPPPVMASRASVAYRSTWDGDRCRGPWMSQLRVSSTFWASDWRRGSHWSATRGTSQAPIPATMAAATRKAAHVASSGGRPCRRSQRAGGTRMADTNSPPINGMTMTVRWDRATKTKRSAAPTTRVRQASAVAVSSQAGTCRGPERVIAPVCPTAGAAVDVAARCHTSVPGFVL